MLGMNGHVTPDHPANLQHWRHASSLTIVLNTCRKLASGPLPSELAGMEIPDHVADILLRTEAAVCAAHVHLWRAEREAAAKELPDQKKNVDMVRMLCENLAGPTQSIIMSRRSPSCFSSRRKHPVIAEADSVLQGDWQQHDDAFVDKHDGLSECVPAAGSSTCSPHGADQSCSAQASPRKSSQAWTACKLECSLPS